MNIRKYIGIPHIDGGRDIETGLDCWGLVRYFYNDEFGIELPEYKSITTIEKDYRSTSEKILMTDCYRNFKYMNPSNTDIDDLRYGDILIFTIGGQPIHTGIFIEKKLMLHSNANSSGIEGFTGIKWNKRIHSYHRHKNL